MDELDKWEFMALQINDLLRNVTVIDGPLARELDGIVPEGAKLGDNAVVFSFGGHGDDDTILHLRRGMERSEVAEGLEAAAQAIREQGQERNG